MFKGIARVLAVAAVIALGGMFTLADGDVPSQPTPPIGGAVSNPTSAPAGTVVGWRGDGSGRYPNANPPTQWYQKAGGESKNILWKTKLPCYSWATPIIVGDKLITRSDPYDLICMNKNTGKLLWIRSYPPFVAVTDEGKKANQAFKAIEPLVSDLGKLNDEYVAKGWSADLYKRKHDLQKKIDQLTAAADDKYKLPPDQYVESWSGYTPQTPCSDGKFIYFNSGDGITACYDLDGNRKWAKYDSMTRLWGEHGYPNSPTLMGDKLLVPLGDVVAMNKNTGEELWRQKCDISYNIQPFVADGIDYAIVACNILRVSDGKVMVRRPGDIAGFGVAIDDHNIYFSGSYVGYYTWQVKGDGLSMTPLITDEYNRIPFPIDDMAKRWDAMHTFYTASPLYYDGLLYCLNQWGKLNVVDTKITNKSAVVFSKNLPFDMRNGKQRKSPGMGVGASPLLAGKYIYMIDSGNCVIVMEPGREPKQVAKNTIEQIVPEWEPNYYTGPHQEQTEATPIADGNRLYIRGEQFMYCIGEKQPL